MPSRLEKAFVNVNGIFHLFRLFLLSSIYFKYSLAQNGTCPNRRSDLPKEKILLRYESNSLCRRCVRACRQPPSVVLVDCPRFRPLPFKITRDRFDQLDLFGTVAKAEKRSET